MQKITRELVEQAEKQVSLPETAGDLTRAIAITEYLECVLGVEVKEIYKVTRE